MANAPSPNDLTRQQLDELDALLQRMLALPQGKPADPPPAAKPVPLPDPVPTPVAAAPAPSPAEWRTDRPTAPPPRAPHLVAPAAEPETADVLEALAGVSRALPTEDVQPTPAFPGSFGLLPPPTAFAPSAVPPTPAEPFVPPEPVLAGRLFGPPTPDTGVLPPGTDPAAFDPVPLGPAAGSDPSIPDFGPFDMPEPPTEELPTVEVSPTTDGPPARPRVPVPLWPVFAANWVLEGVLGMFGPPGQALTSPGMKHLLGGVGVVLLAAAGVWTARGMGWIQLPLP